MQTTRVTLLERLKDHADSVAWREFHQLYAPLLYRYARARGLSREDAEEVRDQCLAAVTQKIGAFQYDKQRGGFKNWLRRMAGNKVIDLLRKHHEVQAESQTIRNVVDPRPAPDEVWERNWHREHLKYCVEQVRLNVSERDYTVFYMLVFGGTTVHDVSQRFNMNAGQIYKSKSRVLQLVRQKMTEHAEIDSCG